MIESFTPDRLPLMFFYPGPASATMGPIMLDAREFGAVTKPQGFPYRCSDPTAAWLDHVNATSYLKQLRVDPAWVVRVNARATRPWKAPAGPGSVATRCWTYAFSCAVDWWNEEYGRPASRYTSFLTGREEQGCDPRLLDLAYRARASAEPDRFHFVPLSLSRTR